MKAKNNLIGQNTFKPSFTPPELLFRGNEEKKFIEQMSSTIECNDNITYLIKGPNGEGKRSFAKKTCKKLINQLKDRYVIIFLKNDCRNNNFLSLLSNLLKQIKVNTSLKINIDKILNLEVHEIWSKFYQIIRKIQNPVILLLTNIDFLNSKEIIKFLKLSKKSKMTLIGTSSDLVSASLVKIFSDFDIIEHLNPLNHGQIYQITKKFCNWIFPFEIDPQIVNYISILNANFGKSLPGHSINVLKDIFPIISEKKNERKIIVNSETIIESFMKSVSDYPIENYLIDFLRDENRLLSYWIALVYDDDLRDHYYITSEMLYEKFLLVCKDLNLENEIGNYNKYLIKVIKKEFLLSEKITKDNFAGNFFPISFKDDKFYKAYSSEKLLKLIKVALSLPRYPDSSL